MPITSSAKKALRNSKKKRIFNLRTKDTLQKAVKSAKKTLDLSAAYQALDKAAKKGVIKKNTASRKKSRLAAMVKKATASK